MAIVAPKGRQQLATEALMAAFAMFSLKSPSLPAFDDTSGCLRAEIYKAYPC